MRLVYLYILILIVVSCQLGKVCKIMDGIYLLNSASPHAISSQSLVLLIPNCTRNHATNLLCLKTVWFFNYYNPAASSSCAEKFIQQIYKVFRRLVSQFWLSFFNHFRNHSEAKHLQCEIFTIKAHLVRYTFEAMSFG